MGLHKVAWNRSILNSFLYNKVFAYLNNEDGMGTLVGLDNFVVLKLVTVQINVYTVLYHTINHCTRLTKNLSLLNLILMKYPSRNLEERQLCVHYLQTDAVCN